MSWGKKKRNKLTNGHQLNNSNIKHSKGMSNNHLQEITLKVPLQDKTTLSMSQSHSATMVIHEDENEETENWSEEKPIYCDDEDQKEINNKNGSEKKRSEDNEETTKEEFDDSDDDDDEEKKQVGVVEHEQMPNEFENAITHKHMEAHPGTICFDQSTVLTTNSTSTNVTRGPNEAEKIQLKVKVEEVPDAHNIDNTDRNNNDNNDNNKNRQKNGKD